MIKKMPPGAITALILVVIIELVIILISSITFRSNIEESYADLQKQSLSTLSQNIQSVIELKTLQYQALDSIEVHPQDWTRQEGSPFDGVAVIKQNRSIELVYKDASYLPNTLTKTTYDKLESNLVNIVTLTELLPQKMPQSVDLLVFSKKINSKIYLMIADFTPIKAQIDAFSFDNLLIISKGGLILYSSNPFPQPYVGNYLSDRVRSEIASIDTLSTPIQEATRLGDKEGSLSYLAFTSPFDSQPVRILSFNDTASMQAFTKERMAAFWVTCLLIFTVSLIGIGVYAHFYRTRYDERFKAIGLGEHTQPYILSIDEWGSIKKSNSAFTSKFNTDNIFSHLVDFGIKPKRIIDNALSFTVKLTDIDGEECYINFSIIKGHKYNKAVGNDATEQMQDYFSKVESYRRDYYTDLLNAKALKKDFDFISPVGECLYIQITVDSIRQYVLSFGETFARKLRHSFAVRLQKVFKDNPKIYYISDSNFAIIIEGTKESNAFSVNINDYLRPLTQPIKVDDNQVSLQIKMGIAEFNGKEKFKSLGALKLEAETALQSISATGRVYAYYRNALAVYGDSYFDNRRTLEKIVNSPDIALYYQPQYDIKGNIVGLEGLCRVENHALRDLSTDRFIALVEKNGLIVDLSRILYKKAFEFAYAIRDKNIAISLNVSPIQLLQTGFISDFLALLRTYDLPPHSICLEITENVLMEDFEDVVKKLRILRKNDVLIQLDDFGVSYSSLLYLKELPIDGIKIDRSFITDIVTNDYSRTIVEKIVAIAKDLHLSCVIEGVESREQLERLINLGDDVTIQGWYYSKAQPQDKIGTLLGYDDIDSIIAAQVAEREKKDISNMEDSEGE